MRYALLGLIQERPRHGYELLAAFTTLIGGVENWAVKPAQVYTTLARLEKQRWIKTERVSQSGGPEKRSFELTAAGRNALDSWLNEPVPSEHRRAHFFLKLVVALAAHAGDPIKLLYGQRALLLKELHDLHGRRSALDPSRSLAHLLLYDQVLMHTEADLRWLDMIEARFDDMRQQPLPQAAPRPRGRPRRASLDGSK